MSAQFINKTTEQLISALSSEDNSIQKEAIELLGDIGDNRAVEPIIQLLGDESVRRIAVEALGKIGDKRAVEDLIELLESFPYRVDAALALGKIGDERAIQPLENILKNPAVGCYGYVNVDDSEGMIRLQDSIRGTVEYAIKTIKTKNAKE